VGTVGALLGSIYAAMVRLWVPDTPLVGTVSPLVGSAF
jgi:hypothetical protein